MLQNTADSHRCGASTHGFCKGAARFSPSQPQRAIVISRFCPLNTIFTTKQYPDQPERLQLQLPFNYGQTRNIMASKVATPTCAQLHFPRSCAWECNVRASFCVKVTSATSSCSCLHCWLKVSNVSISHARPTIR